jgi:hypothetical protein
MRDIIAGVEFAFFWKKLNDMESVRAANDREHHFWRIDQLSLSFRDPIPEGSPIDS